MTANPPALPARWRAAALRFFDAHGAILSLGVWLIALLVMLDLVVTRRVQAVPYGVYAAAGARWIAQQPLYETQTIDGFQYLPTSAWLFSVFARMGSPLGDCAWRTLSCSLYAWGIWRMSKRLCWTHRQACFFIASCSSLGPACNNLGNGQANLMLGALGLHVASELAARRWWRASLVLALGLALKPLFVVLLLLVWPLYRPLNFRLALALLAVFGVTWLTRDPAWLAQQYVDCWTKLGMCAKPDRLFEDLRGLLATLGWLMPHDTYLVVRALAALGVFALAWFVRRRVQAPLASFLMTALAGSYLMLFNPRTLPTSYAIPMACAGLLLGRYVVRGHHAEAIVLVLVVLSWSFAGPWTAPVRHWLKPAACIVFFGALFREIAGAAATGWHQMTAWRGRATRDSALKPWLRSPNVS